MSGRCNKHLSSIILRKAGTTFSLLSGRDQQHLAGTSGHPLNIWLPRLQEIHQRTFLMSLHL